MRTTDVFLAFPYLVLAIAIAAAEGPGLTTVLIALVAVWWPSYARWCAARSWCCASFRSWRARSR